MTMSHQIEIINKKIEIYCIINNWYLKKIYSSDSIINLN